jgi:hypothetical protein
MCEETFDCRVGHLYSSSVRYIVVTIIALSCLFAPNKPLILLTNLARCIGKGSLKLPLLLHSGESRIRFDILLDIREWTLYMGKSLRRKHKAKELAASKKRIQPDDYFGSESFGVARFGRHIVMNNRIPTEQFQEMQSNLAVRFPVVKKEIYAIISKIIEIVSCSPPLQILQRAYWEMAVRHMNTAKESDEDADDIVSVRMVDYLQSIIASAKPAETVDKDIQEKTWDELRTLVKGLFTKLTLEYTICKTAYNQRNDPSFDLDYEQYCYEAEQIWANVRGTHYAVHDIQAIHDLLEPHDEIINKLFGCSVRKLTDNLAKIQYSLTQGIGQLMEDIDNLLKATAQKALERSNREPGTNAPELIARVIVENGWQDLNDSILGRLAGMDLFNIDKFTELPSSLLDELSWEPGQEKEFLQGKEDRGWPLKIWPIFRRPFIKVNGTHYCFDLFSLFDHLYRVMEHLLISKMPDYREIWNKKQKTVAEELPIILLSRLLPGSTIRKSVYYRWYVGDKKKKNWCETDALLIYEDHLFIVEVRAGAFTHASPATDFSFYVESIKNLLFKPAEQGKRFLEYLNSEEEVGLYDKNRNNVGNLSKSSFKHITICTISLDAFTELAAQAQHLKKIGIDVGQHPIWSISIDNLREYADVFYNPLLFLHFVEERMRAFGSEAIKVNDELDHLGLYLKHNMYTKYANEMLQGSDNKTHLRWYGYHSMVDKFFADRFVEPNTKCPLKQTMPQHLEAVIEYLAKNMITRRREIASSLLNCADETRDKIWSQIDYVLARQLKTRKPLTLSTYGEAKVTVFCWQKGKLERNQEFAKHHTLLSMMVGEDTRRLCLELEYDGSNHVCGVHGEFITLDRLSVDQIGQLKIEADRLRRNRIDKTLESSGKIGRNELCPCGSGRKYKNCCLGRKR